MSVVVEQGNRVKNQWQSKSKPTTTGQLAAEHAQGEILAHSWDIRGSKHYDYCKHRIISYFFKRGGIRHMFQYFSTIYSLHVLKYTLEILGNLRGGEIPTSLSSHWPIGIILSSQQMSTNTPYMYFQVANSSMNRFFLYEYF